MVADTSVHARVVEDVRETCQCLVAAEELRLALLWTIDAGADGAGRVVHIDPLLHCIAWAGQKTL